MTSDGICFRRFFRRSYLGVSRNRPTPYEEFRNCLDRGLLSLDFSSMDVFWFGLKKEKKKNLAMLIHSGEFTRVSLKSLISVPGGD